MLFHEIDYENWDRKEIYERFHGHMYCITVHLDITKFLEDIRERSFKFYPSMCYAITKMVNENEEYRFSKSEGKIGYWDSVDAHYTLLRSNSNHLFTQMVTEYKVDFSAFYHDFLQDKEKAEAGQLLYYNNYSPLYTVHITIMPNTTYQSLSFSKPASFTNYGSDHISYVPFVTMGKYFEENGTVKLPVTVEFHHAVNDGYHAEQFFAKLSECCNHLF